MSPQFDASVTETEGKSTMQTLLVQQEKHSPLFSSLTCFTSPRSWSQAISKPSSCNDIITWSTSNIIAFNTLLKMEKLLASFKMSPHISVQDSLVPWQTKVKSKKQFFVATSPSEGMSVHQLHSNWLHPSNDNQTHHSAVHGCHHFCHLFQLLLLCSFDV